MAKLRSVGLLTGLAVLAAGLFGAIHNQISYTVAPEYFHGFKFLQFRIAEPLHNRIGAAQVGLLASWWMGLVIGLIPFLLGAWRQPNAAAFWRKGRRAIVTVIALTSICALLGLAVGLWVVTPDIAAQFPVPRSISDPVAFLRAGFMHDASYLGGVLGLIVATVIMIRR